MSKDKIDIQIIKEAPPCNLEAERAILGNILIDNKKLEEILSIILPGDFYNDANRTILSAMIALKYNDRPIDILTLNAVLEKAKLLKEVGRASYISSLMDGVPKSSNIKHYARIVKEASIYRQIIHVAAKAIASTYGQDGDPTQVIGKLQMGLSGLEGEARRIKAPTQSLGEYLKEKYETEKKRTLDQLLGYRTNGFLKIQRNLDGLQSGLYIIAAYTNRGKTAILTSLCLDVLISNPGITVIYISLDDSKRTIINRLLSIITGIDINKVQKEQKEEEDKDKLEEAYKDIIALADKKQLIIKDIDDIKHINDLEFEIREGANGPLVVLIDDVYNLETGTSYSGLREENVDRAIRIKKLVEIYDIPIICTAELRKKATQESMDRKPSIHDLMETGKFGYKADVVWLLYPGGKDEEFNTQLAPALTLDYAKNKLSDFTKTQQLVFAKAQGTITEDEKKEGEEYYRKKD